MMKKKKKKKDEEEEDEEDAGGDEENGDDKTRPDSSRSSVLELALNRENSMQPSAPKSPANGAPVRKPPVGGKGKRTK